MFEHLDDRDGYQPSTTLLTKVTRDGRRRRRRARVAQAGTASVAALAIGAGVAVTSFNRKLDSVERVEVAALADDPVDPAEPYTILLTGLDLAVPAFVSVPYSPYGPVEEPMIQRSDTIALVRVHPADDVVSYLSVPRDLWIDIPGHGPDRINSAMAIGGPELLVETIEASFDLSVNHYVAIDFEGARALGDAVGGLRLDFPHPLRDRSSGLSITEAGCQTLDGTQLLSLVRARHLESEVSPGVWVKDATSDLGRMERQQDVALAALATFSHLDPADPVEVNRFVDAVVDNVTLDRTFTRDTMLGLFRGVAGSELHDVDLPVAEWTTPERAQVLVPVEGGAFAAALARFEHWASPAGSPPPGSGDAIDSTGHVGLTPC